MFLSKYGEARHIYVPIIKRGVVDFAVSADWTPVAGDVKISKDGGAAANVTNLPTAITMGNTAMWDFSLTATEFQAAQIKVTVADAATKAVEDTMFVVETYGHASAQHALDFDTALSSQTVGTVTTLTNLPSIPANWLTDAGTAASFWTEARTSLFGLDVALSMDANGRVRIVDGTGAGELDTNLGVVLARDHTGAALATAAALDSVDNFVDTEIADIQARLPAALVGGRMDSVLGNTSHGGAAATLELGGTGATIPFKITHENGAGISVVSSGTGVPLVLTGSGGRAIDVSTAAPTAVAARFSGGSGGVLIQGVQAGSIGLDISGSTTGLRAVGGVVDISGDIVGNISGNVLGSVASVAADGITDSSIAASALAELRTYLLGLDVALSMDASGRVRIVDGTGAGEIDTTAGGVLVSALAAQAKADVNAEVLDVLNTDTFAEPGQGAPGATISLAAKIGYLYTSWRNKKDNNGTETKLYDDVGTTVLMKQATTVAGGTVTKAEWITGA
jgi:hypothetical protein